MPKPVWEKALHQCVDPVRARYYWDQLLSTEAGPTLRHATEEQVRVLASLFSGSQALSDVLVAHPTWVLHALNPELLKHPRQPQGLWRDVSEWLEEALEKADYAGALRHLRQFKQREMLRIATRDLAGFGNTMDITQELSNVADICLEGVFKLLWQQFTRRLGTPWHQDSAGHWQPTELSVLGLGKLGGQELNYSSDVDLILIYSEEGYLFADPPKQSDPGKGMSNHQFFTRLAKEFITEVSRFTDEGMLFRVDVRLRPEGNNGPLVRSLQSYENYYAQWGQIWERMMLIKARVIAGSLELGAEFIEIIQSFRYPRNLSQRILDEIAGMKDRMETEVVRAGELERNVKLGRGGIREVEFIAQANLILHAGKNPFLQNAQTLPSLQNLVRYELLSPADSQDLTTAYCFLRDIEHRLQMENNLQTHTIPTERKLRERLAGLMGFKQVSEFELRLREHTSLVRSVYDHILKPESDVVKSDTKLPSDFELHEQEWKQLLEAHGFHEIEHAFQLMEMFVHGPGYVHVSARTADLALELIPIFLAYCPRTAEGTSPFPSPSIEKTLSDPDRVITRLDSYIQAYGNRATLYETWIHNPSLFELCLLLFDRSEFLAEIAIRTPDLVDEVQLSGHLRRRKTSAEMLKELRYGLHDADQMLWLRRYHQAEQLRIGLRDILGLVESGQNLMELSALADGCLRYALEAVQLRHQLNEPPFTIIALGKLGGEEIDYGSDLDLVFVTGDECKDLPAIQNLAIEVMDLLSKPTTAGITFLTDVRLRPDGTKGLLVNTLGAYDDYFKKRAQLWEIQAFTRTRPVAGDVKLGEEFQRRARFWTDFQKPKPVLSAFSSDWKKQIAQMRDRIEKERTPIGKESLAFKTGAGGLIDAEFIAQMLVLENGWQEPNTLKVLLRAQTEHKLPSDEVSLLLPNYCLLRRIEGILRRWSFAGEILLPEAPEALHRVAVRCGYSSAAELLQRVTAARTLIRRIYARFTREEGQCLQAL